MADANTSTPPLPRKLCSVDGCDQPWRKRGWCRKHYMRWARHGDPHYVQRAPNGSGQVSCWGYRVITRNGRKVLEHRVIMEEHLGRLLRPDEIVHHRDHNRLNNAIQNLQVVSTREHRHLHTDRLYKDEWARECGKCGQIKPRSAFPVTAGLRIRFERNRPICKNCRAYRARLQRLFR